MCCDVFNVKAICLTNAFTVLLKVYLQACICARLEMEFDTDCTFAISFSFAKAKHVWLVVVDGS